MLGLRVLALACEAAVTCPCQAPLTFGHNHPDCPHTCQPPDGYNPAATQVNRWTWHFLNRTSKDTP